LPQISKKSNLEVGARYQIIINWKVLVQLSTSVIATTSHGKNKDSDTILNTKGHLEIINSGLLAIIAGNKGSFLKKKGPF
jgi:hypothetical protein